MAMALRSNTIVNKNVHSVQHCTGHERRPTDLLPLALVYGCITHDGWRAFTHWLRLHGHYHGWTEATVQPFGCVSRSLCVAAATKKTHTQHTCKRHNGTAVNAGIDGTWWARAFFIFVSLCVRSSLYLCVCGGVVYFQCLLLLFLLLSLMHFFPLNSWHVGIERKTSSSLIMIILFFLMLVLVWLFSTSTNWLKCLWNDREVV